MQLWYTKGSLRSTHTYSKIATLIYGCNAITTNAISWERFLAQVGESFRRLIRILVLIWDTKSVYLKGVNIFMNLDNAGFLCDYHLSGVDYL